VHLYIARNHPPPCSHHGGLLHLHLHNGRWDSGTQEALLQPFEPQGFKLLTVNTYSYSEQEGGRKEYHGAVICLPDTELRPSNIALIGPENDNPPSSEMRKSYAFGRVHVRWYQGHAVQRIRDLYRPPAASHARILGDLCILIPNQPARDVIGRDCEFRFLH